LLAALRERVDERLILRFGTAIAALLVGSRGQISSDRSTAQRGSGSSAAQSQGSSLRFAPHVGHSPAQSSRHSGASGSSSNKASRTIGSRSITSSSRR